MEHGSVVVKMQGLQPERSQFKTDEGCFPTVALLLHLYGTEEYVRGWILYEPFWCID